MPRERPGFVARRIELPEELDTAVTADAAKRGESVYTYVARALAKRAGVPFTPPKLGRPPKPKPA